MRDTGGNPFLVVAVARELRENRYSPLTAPESIRRDVARRIGRLTATSRNLAKVASVIGDDATLYDAARLGGLLPDQTLPAAEELVKAGILTSDSQFDSCTGWFGKRSTACLRPPSGSIFTALRRSCSPARSLRPN